MYRLIWRLLPGPVWLRVLLALGLATATVVALFAWAFPWASSMFFPAQAAVG